MKTEYPLRWPSDVALTKKKVRSPFRSRPKLIQVIAELERSIDKYGGREPILYTDTQFDSVGEPMEALFALRKGACVTFWISGRRFCFTCDKFDRLTCNIKAISETILSYYKIKNYGTTYTTNSNSRTSSRTTSRNTARKVGANVV